MMIDIVASVSTSGVIQKSVKCIAVNFLRGYLQERSRVSFTKKQRNNGN